VAAIEEGKLNRSSQASRFPQLALEYCLREAGVKMAAMGDFLIVK